MQGVNPWIEVDGGVGPKNAYKVPDIIPLLSLLPPPPFLDEDMGLNCDFWISFTVLVNRWIHVSTDGVWL
jgi:hypothetical protein